MVNLIFKQHLVGINYKFYFLEKNYTKRDSSSVEIPDSEKKLLDDILLICWPNELVKRTNILREELIEPFSCLGYYENLKFSTSVFS